MFCNFEDCAITQAVTIQRIVAGWDGTRDTTLSFHLLSLQVRQIFPSSHGFIVICCLVLFSLFVCGGSHVVIPCKSKCCLG
ncbi:hypothetical protein CHUAL_002732 [Chamberlinius hualienensis]